MPPVHDEVGRLWDLAPRGSKRIDITIAERIPDPTLADERRIPHDEIRLRPRRLARVDVAFHGDAGAFVGDRFAGDRRGFHGFAVPAGDGDAAFVGDVLDVAVPGQHRVAILDVAEIADHRLRWKHVAAGAKVPLQVSDPEHHFGDGRGARVLLDAEQVVRVDRFAASGVSTLTVECKASLAISQVVKRNQHLAFQALEVFERDIKKVATAARRIEHADVA